MIKLRVVGSSDDHSELILSNKPRGKRGSHSVAIDKKLLAVLQDAVYGRKEMEKQAAAAQRALEPRAEPKIPPREIQRQLRAGMSPAQVAKAADVDEDYVDQFYPPILYERMGVVQDVQNLYQEKPRLGRSGLPLGEAVRANLGSRRVNMSDDAIADAWTATRADSQPWVIMLTFPFRGRSRTARWRFDPRTRELTPANKLAADVGWVSSGTKAPPASKPDVGEGRSGASKRSSSRKASGRAAARKASKRPARKAATKKRAAPKRATSRRKPASKRKAAPTRKAASKRKAVQRRPAKKAAPKRKPAKRTATKRKATKRSAARRKPVTKRSAARRKPVTKRSAARRKPAGRSTTRRRR